MDFSKKPVKKEKTMKQILCLCIALFTLVGVANAQKKAVIATEQAMHDFGKIKESGGKVSHDFVLQNKGNAPLIVTRVIASCGCTNPSWDKEPVKPGGTMKLTIVFDPQRRPGPFAKTISVYSNGKTGSMILTIRGEVVD